MLYVWGIARCYGGEVLLRIEDHDQSRSRTEYEIALLDDLEWMGFEADVASIHSFRRAHTKHPFRQSDNADRYARALRTLDDEGLVYACDCTRRTINGLNPQATGEEARYPGTCRGRQVRPTSTVARRVRLAGGEVSIDDLRLGEVVQVPAQQCGDLLARDGRGHWTYQFAVTVDDMAQHIDVVIRGEDLLPSTGRQFHLAALLGRAKPPIVLHHPLVVHPSGAKLSKAARDTSLRERRAAGAMPEQLIGEAAYLAGLTRTRTSLPAVDVARLFLPSP